MAVLFAVTVNPGTLAQAASMAHKTAGAQGRKLQQFDGQSIAVQAISGIVGDLAAASVGVPGLGPLAGVGLSNRV